MKIDRLIACVALAATAGCSAHTAPRTASSSPPSTKASAAAIQDLQTQLSTVFNAPVMAHGAWGVQVRSLDRGDVLFAHNAGKLMMPASNMKILTLAAAAERLGWDHRFSTTLEAAGTLADGTLRGDLIVRGGGDPTISTRGKRSEIVFDEWAAALRTAGITSIEGRIIGDDQAFDDEGVGPGWSWDYLEAGYAAPIGALQYNENTADLVTAPGAAVGDPAIVQLAPGSGLTLVNHARTGEGIGSGLRGSLNVQRRIDRPVLEVSGMIPLGAPAVTRTVAVINPTLFFAQSLKDALIARGIIVTGEAVDLDDVAAELSDGESPQRRVIVTTQSAPLREVAAVLMKVSQNQYAETLLKAVGAAYGGLGTTSAGRRAAAETFTAWGIPADGYVMSDGSGLSRYNYIAPSTITAILARMHGDPRHREPFLATLPVAGKDGTISTRMRRSRAEGNAVAKTGSIANVRSLSGFVKTVNGETLVFSILANDFVIPAATVNWIADLAVEILATFSR
ncbi:MAG TPA: D-alanyl-D-alanine carboxypeptidase/D-alanyl-D-alanine-endopeptidase [Vicinamibacterales bacterium]|nr:D-alanyl-D-alanine carboxypeptidase/D-alanyl-D-alanine-endopeptidase [Vicinamibacterales bacterium]